MSNRTFIALGTASQVPTRRRNHNGYFLRWDEEGLLFDPGEGTQRQMTFGGVSASEITKIFITHFHGDHCLGLAGIIQRISLDRVPHTVEIYYPASGQKFIENLSEASIFHNMAKLKYCPFDKRGVIFQGKKFSIHTEELDHGVDCWGYRLQEHDDRSFDKAKLAQAGLKGPIVGQLKREGQVEVDGKVITLEEVSDFKPGQSMAFVMDTRLCKGAYELAKHVDLLVCESTYLNSEEKDAFSNGHMTAAHAAKVAQEAGARKLILTHFSGRYTSIEPFVEEASVIHPNVVAVNDGDRVDVPKREQPS